jgi:hypothetical protein
MDPQSNLVQPELAKPKTRSLREALTSTFVDIGGWRIALLMLVLFAIFFAAMAWVQFSTPDMPDNDGFYHIRLAEIMRTQGLKPDFPWLPLTILNPREFSDHHFLFHVGLLPFTFGDLRLGAKWAAVTYASLAFLSIWWLLRGQNVPYAWLWALGLLAVSEAFLYRMSITRAQSLSLAVLALGLHWMLKKRYHYLLALAFLYVWLYDAFPLLGIVAVIYTLAVLMIERRLELRPIIYTVIGTVLGLFINPYFPDNLVFVYRHMLPKLTETTEVSVGNEWYPYTTRQILENSFFSLVAILSGIVAIGLRGRRMDTRTATSLFLVFLFGFMLFQSRRFIEYFPAFALIFAALSWAPFMKEIPTRSWFSRHSWPQNVLPLILGALVMIGGWQMLPVARERVQDSKPYDLYAQASAWLKKNTSPGERIFQTDWDDFPRLFFYNTDNTYLIGLDPTYMQLYDPALYDQWVRITQGEIENPSVSISGDFGARYVISDLDHEDFIARATEDPDMEEVYRDDQSVIFAIR